jgi:transglutaminase-like putative cysteine protease
MRLAIRHTTRFRFARPAKHGLHRLRLIPKETQGQRIVDWTMTYAGATEQLVYDDQNHNRVVLVSVDEGAEELAITAAGEVDTVDHAGVLGAHSGHMPLWSFMGQTPLTKAGPQLRRMLGQLERSPDGILPTLHHLSALILDRVPYRKGRTSVATTAEEAIAGGNGVCQDHAHIFLAAARALDVPARYVSGYLKLDDRPDQDATHAWAEAWVEGLGWVGFDVSNGISPDQRYVRVATGRDYRDAAPITGIGFGTVTQDLTVDLAVERQVGGQQQ